MITMIKQTSNTKKLSNFRISTYDAKITTPDKKTVEIIYNSYGVPNLSAVDLGLYGDRNVTILKLNFKDLLWNTADATNYQISLFVDGNKVDTFFEMDNTYPIVTYPIDTTSLTVGTHEFAVSIMEKSKTSGSNIDINQEVYLCRSFNGTVNASDFYEAANTFDFVGISNKGLRRHQIEVMLADDGQFALKQAITSDEQFSTDLGMQYDRFVSYICFNESSDITGKVTNLDKYIVFQNLALSTNYYVKLNTTSGHQHETEDTLTAWVPAEVTEVAGAWTIYFVGVNEDESIRFVSRSISLTVLPTTIPYAEVNPERGINIPVTFELSFYYVSTSTKVVEACAILKDESLSALAEITNTEKEVYLRQGETYILELYPEGEWSYQGGKVIRESRIIYTVPKDATADTFTGTYEITAEPPIQELMITPTEEDQVFNKEGIDGYKPVNVSAIQTETPSVDLSLASGNQTVNATSGKYIKSLTINKPSTLIAANIKKSVVIAGITGTYEFKTQNKTFTPTQTGGSVSADSGYDGLGVVAVNPVPLSNKTDVSLNFYNQSAGTIADSQNIYSDANKFMTWASVIRPETLIAENIKKDIIIAGITGTLVGEDLPVYTGLLRFSTAPTISLSGSTLSWEAIEGATSYDIYKDNALLSNVTTTSVDLSTLITTAGTYAITVKAKASNYADSEASNSVNYVVPSAYNVVLPKAYTNTNVYCAYSIDDGVTWVEMKTATTIQTTQIKFKNVGNSSYHYSLYSTLLGMTLYYGKTSQNYILTQDITDIQVDYYVTCLTGDTLITMADNSQKQIKNVQIGDCVLSLNENGEKVSSKVYYSDANEYKTASYYDLFIFSDGTEIKVVRRHRFYNNRTQSFIHLDEFEVGDKTYKEDGTWVALIDKKYKAEAGVIRHFTIFCEHNTYFANGLLAGNKYSDKLIL